MVKVRVVDRIVSSALDRPMMSEDPENHLAFLVRARSNLYQSDDIIAVSSFILFFLLFLPLFILFILAYFDVNGIVCLSIL